MQPPTLLRSRLPSRRRPVGILGLETAYFLTYQINLPEVANLREVDNQFNLPNISSYS
jgi:hypothetical protein